MSRCHLLCLLVAFFAVSPDLQARDTSEDARIESLLKYVAELDGASFIRSGKSYDGKTASDHLRMKLGKAGSRVKTAEDFIEGIATKSYLTGKLYHIKLKDGTMQESGKLLIQQLALIDKE